MPLTPIVDRHSAAHCGGISDHRVLDIDSHLCIVGRSHMQECGAVNRPKKQNYGC